MSNVIIFGANGRTGRHLVTEALQYGHNVTAAVRNPNTFADYHRPSSARGTLRIAQADVSNPDSVRSAVTGMDAAISAIGTGRKPNGIYSNGTRVIVDAVEHASVERFICISSGGVHHDDPNLGFIYGKIISPLFMTALYDDIRKMEDIVTASSLAWTLPRPAYLVDKPARGTWRVEDASNPKGGWQISRLDLATFIVNQLATNEWLRRHPTIAW